jgi:hypothetical protein
MYTSPGGCGQRWFFFLSGTFSLSSGSLRIMAVSTLNWVFIALSFICAIPACALMWRVFDSEENIKDDYRRQADYEVCGFIFFWVTAFFALYKSREGASGTVARSISIGIVVYLTVLGTLLPARRALQSRAVARLFTPCSGVFALRAFLSDSSRLYWI